MTTNHNQDIGKINAALYLVQNKLAFTTNEAERKKLLAKQKKLNDELRLALEKNDPTRKYCTDNKCTDMKNLTTNLPKHIKHLP